MRLYTQRPLTRYLHSASTCSRSSACSSCVISRPDTRTTSQAPRSQWVSFERAALFSCCSCCSSRTPRWTCGGRAALTQPDHRVHKDDPTSIGLPGSDRVDWCEGYIAGADLSLLLLRRRPRTSTALRSTGAASRTRVGLLQCPRTGAVGAVEATTARQRRSAKRAAGRATVPLASLLPSVAAAERWSW